MSRLHPAQFKKIIKMNNDKQQKIEEAFKEIRPFLQRDGGDIQLVKLKEEEVVVKFLGNCYNCKINNLTLKVGVTKIIQKYLPEIKSVKQLDEQQHYEKNGVTKKTI